MCIAERLLEHMHGGHFAYVIQLDMPAHSGDSVAGKIWPHVSTDLYILHLRSLFATL